MKAPVWVVKAPYGRYLQFQPVEGNWERLELTGDQRVAFRFTSRKSAESWAEALNLRVVRLVPRKRGGR